MRFIEKVANRLGFTRRKRGYDAAIVNRLTSNWTIANKTSDEELKTSLRALRARSRNLAMNNDYARKYLKLVVANVVGVNGIVLQSKVKQPSGEFDKGANKIIEEAWAEWGKRGVASICGQLSWRDIERLAIESVARDGEILIRKVFGYDNYFRFALQVLEADHLDEDYNREPDSRNSNSIRMGIELNPFGRPVAYHLLQNHPGANTYNYSGKNYERIPAEQIIHVFYKERPTQSRGVPWMHTAMTRLNMLGGYEEAELVAARVGASKMGFFTSEGGNGVVGDGDTEGEIIDEAEPGTFGRLPEGVDFKPWDPSHPNTAFKDFGKAILRGVSSGVNVSYNSLSSDLEGVNYSSIRQGVLDERDQWRVLQTWNIGSLHDQVFSSWLRQGMDFGAINLPPRKFKKFNVPKWQPRGWGWVDPLKDTRSNINSVAAGLKTRGQVVAEQGLDLEDIFKELKREEDLAKEYGLTLSEGKSIKGKDSKDAQKKDDK